MSVVAVLLLIGFVGFLWSLVVSVKKGSAAGIIMTFVFWPIGLIIALSAAAKQPQVVYHVNGSPPV